MPIEVQRSLGSGISKALKEHLIQRETDRRQEMLDGIMLEDKHRQRQQEDQERQRQERLDAQVAEDRQRRITHEDTQRELAPFAPGDLVDDSIGKRYPQHVRDGQFIGTPGQRDASAKDAARLAEREADRQRQEAEKEDARGNRYLDAELRRNERAEDATASQRESAASRANARWVVDRQMSGKDKDEPTHDAAAVTLDALDELSGAINRQEGIAAKVAGSWKHAVAAANYNDDVAEYESTLVGAIPLVARKMGHTGPLTQPDVDSVRGMFPKPGDSKTLRDRKMARIRQIMNMPGKSNDGSGGNTGGNTGNNGGAPFNREDARNRYGY